MNQSIKMNIYFQSKICIQKYSALAIWGTNSNDWSKLPLKPVEYPSPMLCWGEFTSVLWKTFHFFCTDILGSTFCPKLWQFLNDLNWGIFALENCFSLFIQYVLYLTFCLFLTGSRTYSYMLPFTVFSQITGYFQSIPLSSHSFCGWMLDCRFSILVCLRGDSRDFSLKPRFCACLVTQVMNCKKDDLNVS